MKTETQTRQLPPNFWQTPGLTLENFSTEAEKQTGSKIRFRRTKDQVSRGLTRQEAFNEIFEKHTKIQLL